MKQRPISAASLMLAGALVACSHTATTSSNTHSQSTVTVTVDPSQVGPTMSVNDLGAGLSSSYNLTLPGIAQGFQNAHLALTRYPDGAIADRYNWPTSTTGTVAPCTSNANPASTFDATMQDIAIPANLSVAIEANYGSDPTCTKGADPNDTAGWLEQIQSEGYNVTSATVGNEQYTSGAIDCRQPGCKSSQDPTQYAANEPAFYNAFKAADPDVPVCVDVDMASPTHNNWNPYVFAHALYDCAEIHYYPQGANQPTRDHFLLHDAISQLTAQINVVKQEFTAAGHPNTKIYLGEIANGLGPYGTQSQSIVNALYAGMAIGEAEQDGVWQMTWHIAHGNCNTPKQGGDWSSYGLQRSWAGAMIFADKNSSNCPITVPANTLLPVANAFLTASYFVHAGEKMLRTSVPGSTDVRAYGATYQGGYAVMLFNLNKTTAQTVAVSITGKSSGSGGTVVAYDKALYDEIQGGVYSLAPWTNSIQITLPPWSMVVVQTQ